MKDRRMPKIAALLTALMLAASAGSAAGGQAGSSSSAEFEIPAENLSDALNKFGKQTGMQVVYAPDLARGVKSRALSGKLTVDAALQRLLAGTGLTWDYVNSTTVILKKANAATGLAPADQMRVASATYAVDAAAENRDTKDNQMVVKGDRDKQMPDFAANADLPRTVNDAQPYYIFDAETVAQSGAVNLEDFLRQRLTMNTAALSAGQEADTNFNATSRIDLRGLGADNTLILVDGRRIAGVSLNGLTQVGGGNAPPQVTAQANINGIPLAAVERIEVLPSSASGIYGGAAVGGVINIILKKSYSGGEVSYNYSNTLDTDAPRRRADLTYGFPLEGGRTNVLLTGGYSDEDGLLLGDRSELAARGFERIRANAPGSTYLYSTSRPPSLGNGVNISLRSGTYTVYDAAFTEVIAQYTNPVNDALRFKDGVSIGATRTFAPAGADIAALTAGLVANAGSYDLTLPLTTGTYGAYSKIGSTPIMKSFGVDLNRKFSERLEMFLALRRSESQGRSRINSFDRYFIVPGNAPTNPFQQNINVHFPSSAADLRSFSEVGTALTAGGVMNLPHSWMLGFDYTLSNSGADYSGPAGGDQTALNIALADGTIDPFADRPTLDCALAPFAGSYIYSSDSVLRESAVRAAGPVFALTGGDVVVSASLGRREQTNDPSVEAYTFPLTPYNDYANHFFEKSQTVNSMYTEFKLPIVGEGNALPGVRGLDMQLAGRWEKYAASSGTFGLLVHPNRDEPDIYLEPTRPDGSPYSETVRYSSFTRTLGLRYMPARDLIARASVATAFLPPTPETLIPNQNPDPFMSFVYDPVLDTSYEVATVSGGNPDLRPQTSRSWNAGLIYEPQDGKLKGLRANIEYYRTTYVDLIKTPPGEAGFYVQHEPEYPDRVVRDPGSGLITRVDNSYINLARYEARSWDGSVGYGREVARGRVSLDVNATYNDSLTLQVTSDMPALEFVEYVNDGGVLKFKGNATLRWEQGPLLMGFSSRYFASYFQSFAPGSPQYGIENGSGITTFTDAQGGYRIPSQIYHDIFMSYRFGESPSHGSLLDGISLQGGIKNVFGSLPPFDAYRKPYFYSSFGDIRLREYWLNIKKSF